MKAFKVGTQVQWRWMGRHISGKVKEVFLEPITQVIKSKKIKRNASIENPAYLVESKAGNLALKLQTELIREPQNSGYKGPKPTMFGED